MAATAVPQAVWDLQIPLFITHVDAPNSPFITSVPRFSYLALLLPRLAAYFGLPCSSFQHEDVLLRNLAVGLLVDLYQPSLPWRLTVGDGLSWDIGDTFLNSAKEVGSGHPHETPKRYYIRHPACDDDHEGNTNGLVHVPLCARALVLSVY